MTWLRRPACLLLLLLALALLTVPGLARESASKNRKNAYQELEMFANVLTLVQQYYVDETEMPELMQGAVDGMLGSLDPHSGYLSPEDYQDLEDETSGSFIGIGIEVTQRDGVLLVLINLATDMISLAADPQLRKRVASVPGRGGRSDGK